MEFKCLICCPKKTTGNIIAKYKDSKACDMKCIE